MLQGAQLQSFPRGYQLLTIGEVVTRALVVVTGTVRCSDVDCGAASAEASTSTDGWELRTGDSLGELCLLSPHAISSVTAVCTSPLLCIEVEASYGCACGRAAAEAVAVAVAGPSGNCKRPRSDSCASGLPASTFEHNSSSSGGGGSSGDGGAPLSGSELDREGASLGVPSPAAISSPCHSRANTTPASSPAPRELPPFPPLSAAAVAAAVAATSPSSSSLDAGGPQLHVVPSTSCASAACASPTRSPAAVRPATAQELTFPLPPAGLVLRPVKKPVPTKRKRDTITCAVQFRA
eukprot:tig00021374_g21086.t1